MAIIQEISGRIGRTTGEGIAANIRNHYPNWILQSIVTLLLVANTINIGADLGAMGDAVDLLVGGPKVLYVILFGASCAMLQHSGQRSLPSVVQRSALTFSFGKPLRK
jgi:Mn2+/Fe2+ NRAMP family transporter